MLRAAPVIAIAAIMIVIVGCGSSDADATSRGGQTNDTRAAKANDQTATNGDGGGAEGGALEGGSCEKTINCNSGDCSCGSGANIGKACNKDSGECDVLCSVC